jgi:FecR protein
MYFPVRAKLPKLVLVLFFFLAVTDQTALADEILVGSVKSVHGGAIILRGPVSIPVKEGAHLLLNDLLQTSHDGAIGAILQDGTRLSLGPDTELKIDRFVYQPADGKFGLLIRLTRGAMAYISGKIAQFSPGSVSVETPEAVLGLRGTEFIVSIDSAVPVNRSSANQGAGKNGI